MPTYLPPTNLPTYLPTYLPATYQPTYLPTYLLTCHQFTYLRTYLPTYLPTYLSIYLPRFQVRKNIISRSIPTVKRGLIPISLVPGRKDQCLLSFPFLYSLIITGKQLQVGSEYHVGILQQSVQEYVINTEPET